MAKKEENPLGYQCITPHIVFDYMFLDTLLRDKITDLNKIYKETERLRKRAKTAVGYNWDNTNFYITDLYGHESLQVQFSPDSISFWAEKNGQALDTITEITQETVDLVRSWIKMFENDSFPCPDCGKTVPIKGGVFYGFAGYVCKKCYDPKKHLPADTRGD